MNKKIIIFSILILLVWATIFLYTKLWYTERPKKEANIVEVLADVRYTWNSEKCEDILETGMREKCIAIWDSVELYRDVMTNWNKERCDEIENVSVKQTCINQINTKKYRFEAVMTWTPALCNKIQNVNTRKMCISRVKLFKTLISEWKPENCIQFINNDLVKECEKRIEAAK